MIYPGIPVLEEYKEPIFIQEKIEIIMDQSPQNREATATIRGYVYQFDATILKILRLQGTETLLIEGVEDFDISKPGTTDYFQCKYYASQHLTDSTTRDCILPMLKNFILSGSKRRDQYHLYGHFKDAEPEDRTLTIEDLKRILVRKEQTKSPPHLKTSESVRYKTVNVQQEIGATDDDLHNFSQSLTIHICASYEEHKTQVVDILIDTLRISPTEAKEFSYPTALTLVSDAASKKATADRKISRDEFLKKLIPSVSLHNIWLLKEKGETAYCKELRRQHFSAQNIDTADRLFVIEIPNGSENSHILDLVHTIINKWSSHSVRRKPDNERYAPYLMLRNISEENLSLLRTSLYGDGVRFVDGYPFRGANFCHEDLSSPQTYENGISLRLTYDIDNFFLSSSRRRRRKIIYQFFFEDKIDISKNCSHISMPITSIGMVKNII